MYLSTLYRRLGFRKFNICQDRSKVFVIEISENQIETIHFTIYRLKILNRVGEISICLVKFRNPTAVVHRVEQRDAHRDGLG